MLWKHKQYTNGIAWHGTLSISLLHTVPYWRKMCKQFLPSLFQATTCSFNFKVSPKSMAYFMLWSVYSFVCRHQRAIGKQRADRKDRYFSPEFNNSVIHLWNRWRHPSWTEKSEISRGTWSVNIYATNNERPCPSRRHQMKTFSALLALCVENSPDTGELPSQRSVRRSFDIFFDLGLNKRLSKQLKSWWFETTSCSLWRHHNVLSQNNSFIRTQKQCVSMIHSEETVKYSSVNQ